MPNYAYYGISTVKYILEDGTIREILGVRVINMGLASSGCLIVILYCIFRIYILWGI